MTSRRPAALAAILLLAPGLAAAVVVVRHPVYVAPRAVVVVAPAPVYVAPPPTVVVVPPPQPQPAPPPLTAPLPVNSTMWVLPSGCMKVSVSGQALYQCGGGNWLRQFQSDKGPYYAVVAPPA